MAGIERFDRVNDGRNGIARPVVRERVGVASQNALRNPCGQIFLAGFELRGAEFDGVGATFSHSVLDVRAALNIREPAADAGGAMEADAIAVRRLCRQRPGEDDLLPLRIAWRSETGVGNSSEGGK